MITDAAKDLRISRKQLSEIINEKSSIPTEMAIRFKQVFKIAAIFWLDLQRDFDLWKIKESGKIHLKPQADLRA